MERPTGSLHDLPHTRGAFAFSGSADRADGLLVDEDHARLDGGATPPGNPGSGDVFDDIAPLLVDD
jgi:hypothetical protein